MSEIIDNEAAMPRSIRPSEAMKAWEVIKKSPGVVAAAKAAEWHAWTRVLGPFIRQRTDKAKREAGSTRGPAYSAELKKVMGDKLYPVFKKLGGNGTLSYLMRILDNLDAVNTWRNLVPEEVRPTSPMRVWEGYEFSLRSTIAFKDADDDEEEDGGPILKREPISSRRAGHNTSLRDELPEMFAAKADELFLRWLHAHETPDAFAEALLRRMSEQGSTHAEMIDMLIKFGQALLARAERLKREAAGSELLSP